MLAPRVDFHGGGCPSHRGRRGRVSVGALLLLSDPSRPEDRGRDFLLILSRGILGLGWAAPAADVPLSLTFV